MTSTKPKRIADWISVIPEDIPEEVTEADDQLFMEIVSTLITPEQEARVVNPLKTYPRQRKVLATHWHPEFVPITMIKSRIQAVYPGKNSELIIPTQHNVFTSYGDYTGVEVDCYSKGFNQKVQLLLHFKNERLQDAHLLKSMVAHTFKYRSSQLFEYVLSITKPIPERIDIAARETGANDELIRFVRIYVRKIEYFLEKKADEIPAEMIKNKILRNFFDGLRPLYGDALIDRVQTFIRAVKQLVKADFSLQYFYRTSEVIEEARSLGAGIVIPHPEQFWPILLANYDVDGYEVWNPQSRRYTEFLISIINRNNDCLVPGREPLLVFMGDDTHMSEKVRDPEVQNPEKAAREIGYQPAWDDFSIRKALIRANIDRRCVIEEYKRRLGG
jgi:hypothetical protein